MVAFTFTHNEFVLQFAKLIIKSRQVKVNVFTHTRTQKLFQNCMADLLMSSEIDYWDFLFPIVFFFPPSRSRKEE